jgi:hypothetical protein
MNPTVAKSLKIVSTLAMTGALGLLGWNLSLHLQGESLPSNLTSLFWLGSVALVAHGVEAIIAGLKARAHNKNPLRYGIYTFFVGFVGLQELVEAD